MKIVLLLAFCYVFVETATAQTWIAGTPVRRGPSRGGRTVSTEQKAEDMCTADNFLESFCDNADLCQSKNLFICTGAGEAINSTCNGGYCTMVDNEAKCVTASNCTAQSADFKCTSEGFFPDPSSCYKFYQCLEDDSGAILSSEYSCPGPYVFDPSGPNNKFCRLTNGNIAYCSVAKCATGKIFENVVMRFSWYPASLGQYVVTCLGGKAVLTGTRCPAGLTPNLTPIKPKCELVCTRAAIAAHPTDVTQYYECLYNAFTRKWEKIDQTCFKSWMFDEKLKTCIPAPKCTNGANNPPKCNACTGNKAFADGSCTDCGSSAALNTTTGKCEPCPETSKFNAEFKGCLCDLGTQAIDYDISQPTCKACATTDKLEIDASTKKCKCLNGATDPFASTSCGTCASGQGFDQATGGKCVVCEQENSLWVINTNISACKCANAKTFPSCTT